MKKYFLIICFIFSSILTYAKVSTEDLKLVIENMTLKEKIGQMFLVSTSNISSTQLEYDFIPGGYILFGYNFKDKLREDILNGIDFKQSNSSIPLLFAVDEEGGKVNRISKFKHLRQEPFLSSQEIFKKGNFLAIKTEVKGKIDFLKRLGINMNMAPICDVSTDERDYIYQRTFGKDAEETSKYITLVTEILAKEKMGMVLKHFPGYGNNDNTHTGIVYDERPLNSFLENDFKPFKAGIKNGAHAVLVCHNVVKAMDPNLPASLSSNVINILRKDLKFDGVIITDDMSMKGLTDFTHNVNPYVMAILAGNDIICTSGYTNEVNIILKSVQDKVITEERINESVMRILALKAKIGLIH